MTHLSNDVSNDSLGVLEWLLQVAPDEVVSCPGGWVSTLKAFCAMLGWSTAGNSGWTSGAKASIQAKDAASRSRQIGVLAKFLQAGLRSEGSVLETSEQFWDSLHRLDGRRDPFAYLNLYGARRDEDGEMYQDQESRQGVFSRRFLELVAMVADQAKKDGGALGRAAANLDKILSDSKAEMDVAVLVDTKDLLDLW